MKTLMFVAVATVLSLSSTSPLLAQSNSDDCYYNGMRFSHGAKNEAGQTCIMGVWRR